MTDPTTLPLAADFPPATADEWRKLVDGALKGKPFERLTSRSSDGIAIEPLYGRATSAQAIAGRAPGKPWRVMQQMDHPGPDAANALAREDLENGATGLTLVFAGSVSANSFGLDGTDAALSRALDGLELSGLAIDLQLSFASRHAARDIAAGIKSRGIAPSTVDLLAGINPIGAFAATGRVPRLWGDLAPLFAELVGEIQGTGFRGPFAVADGRIVHNAGGSEAQELAFTLATAVTYLRALDAAGVTLEAARDAIYFRLAADADQFLTMAKFRAARKLWARIEVACGLSPKPVMLLAETAWRMMTRHDPYVNMLRAAIATSAAGLGGADAVTVLPYTAALGLPDALARRIARNTQLLLLEESNLARVSDPAAGSGALEALTDALCGAGWALFREIEAAGGIFASLQAGMFQQKVAIARAEHEKAIARRKEVLTGTNQFPDIHETVPAVFNVAPPAVEDAPAAMTAAPLKRMRLAEPYEKLRDRSDRILAATGTRPSIFLAALGSPAEFTPRATFAKNFFEAGGIEAISPSLQGGEGRRDAPRWEGELTSDALASAFKASGATLACLCSSDKIYEAQASAAAAVLSAAGAKHIYLAGRPAEREAALKEAGVQSFIYEGCDALSTLEAAYVMIGA